MRTGLAVALALGMIGGGLAAAADLAATVAERSAMSLTVYGGGLALVRDARTADLPAGRSRVVFSDVSRHLLPTSPFLAAESGLTVLALDVEPASLTQEALLRRALGQDVRVVRTHPTTGEDSVETATVLAVDGGVVLRYRDRVETGIPGRLAFPGVPSDLRPAPAVAATVEAGAGGRRPLTLGYLTNGVSWGADYVMVVDDAGERLDLTARAAVSNDSGTDFAEARLAVVAGDVRRVSAPPMPAPRSAANVVGAMMADAAPEPEREAVADLHLYTIPGAVTLADGDTTLVTLFRAAGVPFRRDYVSESFVAIGAGRGGPRRPQHPRVELSFDNAAANGLGVPLPRGVARVFVSDQGSELRLSGEDGMMATPVGGTVTLSPGRAFDITVERTQTDFRRVGADKGPFESAQRIEVRNGKDRPVTVKVVEMVPGDWTILEESAGHEKEAADRIVWRVETPAGGAAVVTYRIRIQR